MYKIEQLKQIAKEKGITYDELVKRTGISISTIKDIFRGKTTAPRIDTIQAIEKALGIDDKQTLNVFNFSNIHNVETIKVPMLGKIACGKPIYMNEEKESYVKVGTNLKIDFCLTASGDSMINARIYDGDIVFCRSQNMVENGEIAVVSINDEATLKRLYYYPEKNKLVLQAENPKYEPLVYVNEELNDVRILGKAVAFQSDIK